MIYMEIVRNGMNCYSRKYLFILSIYYWGFWRPATLSSLAQYVNDIWQRNVCCTISELGGGTYYLVGHIIGLSSM